MTTIKDIIYIGDTGVEVTADVGVSTVGVTKQEIHVKLPDKTLAVWTATIKDDKHIVSVVDFPNGGVYTGHAYCEWGGASTHHGKAFTITVYPLYTVQ